MPITQSAKKALRKDQRRRLVNLRIKNKVKMAIKKAKAKKNKKSLALAYAVLDRAVKKGILHQNKAARCKSQLAAL